MCDVGREYVKSTRYLTSKLRSLGRSERIGPRRSRIEHTAKRSKGKKNLPCNVRQIALFEWRFNSTHYLCTPKWDNIRTRWHRRRRDEPRASCVRYMSTVFVVNWPSYYCFFFLLSSFLNAVVKYVRRYLTYDVCDERTNGRTAIRTRKKSEDAMILIVLRALNYKPSQ